MADEVDFSQYSVDELKAIAGIPTGPVMTPAPSAPAVDQLMTPVSGATSAPSPIELGVAQMRTRSPLEQALADIQGRRLLAQEAYSVGILPKVEAGAEAAKALLFGRNPLQQFAQETERQDILKELVRQKDLEQNQLILGMTGPEIGGSLLSPIGRLYTPGVVARGAPLASALATRGANVAKAAGTGAGAAGLQTFLSTPGTVEERLSAAQEIAGPAALIAGGAGGLGEVLSLAAPAIEKAGLGLQRTSLGLGKRGLSAARNAVLETPAGNFESQVTKSFNNLIKENVLGSSRDPDVVYQTARIAKDEIEDQIQDVLKSADASGVKVQMPSFAKTKAYLESSRVALPDLDSYNNIIKDFEIAVKNESKFVEPKLPTLYDEFGNAIPKAELGGMKTALEKWQKENAARSKLSLDVLNKQRKVFGEKYKTSPQSDPGFWRAFYGDLKEHIEKYAPEVQELNRRKQDLIVAEPILQQAKKAAEMPMTPSDVRRALLYTTGGAGLPGAALLTGSPVLGALIAGGFALAGTKTGQNVLGETLRKSGKLATALGSKGVQAGAANRPEIMPMFSPTEAAISDTNEIDYSQYSVDELKAIARGTETQPEAPAPSVSTKPATKQNISALIAKQPPIIQAIIDTESSGNPNARSEVGAVGLMQLMPGTANDLGVDPLDPVKNIEGGTRYYNQMRKKFPDMKTAIASYNWGPGNMAKAVAKVESKGQKPTWQNILKYNSVPTETEEYVKRVIKKLNQLEA